MKTIKNLINSKDEFLCEMIKRDYFKQIIMYKTWDNDYCRIVCIQTINMIQKKVALYKKKICDTKFIYSKVQNYNVLLKKIFEDFEILKEYCEYGCIHRELEFSIYSILTLVKSDSS